MDVSQAAEQLVHVHLKRRNAKWYHRGHKGEGWRGWSQRSGGRRGGYLHIYDRNDALGLVKMSGNPVHRLWDKVQHQVEVHFILLWRNRTRRGTFTSTIITHTHKKISGGKVFVDLLCVPVLSALRIMSHSLSVCAVSNWLFKHGSYKYTPKLKTSQTDTDRTVGNVFEWTTETSADCCKWLKNAVCMYVCLCVRTRPWK